MKTFRHFFNNTVVRPFMFTVAKIKFHFHLTQYWRTSNAWIFCSFTGNTDSVTQCSAGYYCTSGAYNSTPTDGTTGNICPPGRYCEVGSITGVGCPVGTFSNQAGLKSSSECTNCTGGYYCGSTGLTVESGLCHAGKRRMETSVCIELSLSSSW